MNVQAFCDGWCRFQVFDMLSAGSTNDISAYKKTELCMNISKSLSEGFYFALDEAYKSLKDGVHLTPYPGADIQAAIAEGNHRAANIMRTFNKIFCSDRITIERAFGQLVRRWGALWGAIPRTKFVDISLMIRVAVKLHNLYVDEWLCNRFGFLSGEDGKSYPVPNIPTTIDRVHCNINEEASLPVSDVPELVEENIVSASELNRDDITYKTVHIGPRTATEIVGRAMTNVVEEQTARQNYRVTESQRTITAAMFPDLPKASDNRAIRSISRKDASAAKRLQFALNIKAN